MTATGKAGKCGWAAVLASAGLLAGCDSPGGITAGIPFIATGAANLTPTTAATLPALRSEADSANTTSPDDLVIPYLVRQPDCSLTLLYVDQSGRRRGAATPNYQTVLRNLAGLATPANP